MRIVQCKNATASCFSHVEPKHVLVKTEDSPDDIDGPSASSDYAGGPDDYAGSLNRHGGQFFHPFKNMI